MFLTGRIVDDVGIHGKSCVSTDRGYYSQPMDALETAARPIRRRPFLTRECGQRSLEFRIRRARHQHEYRLDATRIIQAVKLFIRQQDRLAGGRRRLTKSSLTETKKNPGP